MKGETIYKEYIDSNNVSHQLRIGFKPEQCDRYKKELSKDNPDVVILNFTYIPTFMYSWESIQSQTKLIELKCHYDREMARPSH